MSRSTLRLHGGTPLRGSVRLPGCKGVSHRALVAAALAGGESTIGNLGSGRDVANTRVALAGLGVAVHGPRDAPDGRCHVRGAGFAGLREPTDVIDCGNSGTTMRFLAGLVAGREFLTVLRGDSSLSRRPMARVVEPLRAMGAMIDGRDRGRFAPLVIRGAPLQGRRHELAVASGQVKTALVLAGLQATGATEIVEPAPSRDHTERLFGFLGAPVERIDQRTVRVEAGSPAPFHLDVPGDPSSAAFFVVGATLVAGSHVVLEDVLGNPGRLGYLDVLEAMGASVVVHPRGARGGEPVVDLEVRAAPLAATTIRSHEAIVDELPVLAVAAAFAEGVTEIRGAAELRVKESDRIAALLAELTKLGADVVELEDGLRIEGRPAALPESARFDGHGDHRIAMACAVAACALPGESTVTGWDAVAVSYPEFVAHLSALGGRVRAGGASAGRSPGAGR